MNTSDTQPLDLEDRHDLTPEVPVTPPSFVDNAVMEAAADERDASYSETFSWTRPDAKGVLESYDLFDYSLSRETLYHRLSAIDAPIPLDAEIGSLDALAGSAFKILFVCSHTPEQLIAMRQNLPKMLLQIDEWVDKTIPRTKVMEATSLGLRIHNAKNKHLAVARPSDKKADSGN